ncbi:MAG: PcfJ domain-containing protein, partial [Leptodesmis sp.]|uniref:PcfJ domain-containing protein n=1 Tax=Leptodesmis sp. TaxID=3100501 RepID=UPI003D109033
TGQIFEAWGRQRHASLQRYLEAIAATASPQRLCREFFGSAGKATVKAFQSASQDSWLWAAVLCDRNPDAAQKILSQSQIIGFEPEAIDFLRSLPMSARLRLLGATTFRYRGETHPISPDHVRDTGYLWKNIQQKPELGRIRCWFSVHEQLSAAFVKELPDDEVIPVPAGWERVDGLAAVDGAWELEFPKRVATLKRWGEILRNCVGGYGPAIRSGRSVVFAVRERGAITHCVEVVGRQINQFYRSGNSDPDPVIKDSVCESLRQARLIDFD